MANNSPEYRASYTDSFSHGFDAKGRITVPSDWREEPFESRLVILRSASPCLRVYPASWLSKLQQHVDAAREGDPQREMLQQLARSAQNTTFDQQGRIMVKEQFRRDAGLKKDAMLIGCSDHFQIWDKAAWESRQPAPVTVEDALRAMGR